MEDGGRRPSALPDTPQELRVQSCRRPQDLRHLVALGGAHLRGEPDGRPLDVPWPMLCIPARVQDTLRMDPGAAVAARLAEAVVVPAARPRTKPDPAAHLRAAVQGLLFPDDGGVVEATEGRKAVAEAARKGSLLEGDFWDAAGGDESGRPGLQHIARARLASSGRLPEAERLSLLSSDEPLSASASPHNPSPRDDADPEPGQDHLLTTDELEALREQRVLEARAVAVSGVRLLQAFDFAACTVLELHDCSLGDRGAAELCSALRAAPHGSRNLRELRLGHNGITADGAAHIADLCVDSAVGRKAAERRRRQADMEHDDAMASAPLGGSVRYPTLGVPALDSDSLEVFHDPTLLTAAPTQSVLPQHQELGSAPVPCLTALDLSWNELGDEACTGPLLALLVRQAAITQYRLGFNCFGPEGAQALLDGLRASPAISVFDTEGNPDAGACGLEALEQTVATNRRCQDIARRSQNPASSARLL